MKKYLDLSDINEALSKSGFKSVSISIEDSKTLNILATCCARGEGMMLKVGLGCGMNEIVDMEFGGEEFKPVIFVTDILIDTIRVNPNPFVFMDNIKHPKYEKSGELPTIYYRYKELPKDENEILYF